MPTVAADGARTICWPITSNSTKASLWSIKVESPTPRTSVTDIRRASPAARARNISVHTSVGSTDGAYVVLSVDGETSAS
eukprot:4855538-Prymnesium_polylepis.2